MRSALKALLLGGTSITGTALLLAGEGSGFAADFTAANQAKAVLVRNNGDTYSSPDAFFTNAGTSPKLVYDVTGTLVWSPHNLFLNSASPATQTVTTITGATYTVTVTGSGSLAMTSGGSGTASAGSPATFVATGTSTVCTLTGSLTTIQMNRGSVVTAYLATTAAARFGLAIDYDPVTHACKGLLVEPAATNLLLNSATLSTQSVSVTAQAYTLSLFGTGTITLSGTSTAGPLVGTGASDRVSLTFTPTAGTLTLTVSGSVTNAQLEAGSTVTSVIPSFAATVTRAADLPRSLLSAISALGTEYSVYVQAVVSALTGFPTVVSLNGSSGAERTDIYAHSGQASHKVLSGGVNQAEYAVGSITAGVVFKAATRTKANNFGMSVNGSAVSTDTSGIIPGVMINIDLGHTDGGSPVTPKWIRQVVILPTRGYSDAELIAKAT